MTAQRWVSDEFVPRRTIIDYLFADAATLDALLAEARAFGDEGFVDAARSSFATFARRLDRHFRLEEEAVLPRLPRRDAPAAARLRREHDRLRALVALADEQLALDDGAKFARVAGRLGDVNRRHERNERRLYGYARDRI